MHFTRLNQPTVACNYTLYNCISPFIYVIKDRIACKTLESGLQSDVCLVGEVMKNLEYKIALQCWFQWSHPMDATWRYFAATLYVLRESQHCCRKKILVSCNSDFQHLLSLLCHIISLLSWNQNLFHHLLSIDLKLAFTFTLKVLYNFRWHTMNYFLKISWHSTQKTLFTFSRIVVDSMPLFV